MQITLRQREIEAALKGYVLQQGINLTGKTIAIAFTAGRKESGISAEIDIEEAGYTGIPGYSDAEADKVEAPVALTVVKTAFPEIPAPHTEGSDIPEQPPVVEEPVEAKKTATSLFG